MGHIRKVCFKSSVLFINNIAHLLAQFWLSVYVRILRQRASNNLLNKLAIKAKEAARYAVRNGYSSALDKVSFAEYNNNDDYQLRLSGGNEEYHLQTYGRRLKCLLIIMVINLKYSALPVSLLIIWIRP